MKKRIFITITSIAIILIIGVALKNIVFNSKTDEDKDVVLNETTEEQTQELTEPITSGVDYPERKINTVQNVYKDSSTVSDDTDVDTSKENNNDTIDELDEISDSEEDSEEFIVLEPITEPTTKAKTTADTKSTVKNKSETKIESTTEKVIVIDESSKTKKDNVEEKEYDVKAEVEGTKNQTAIDWDQLAKEAVPNGEDSIKTVISDLSGENVGTWEKPD